MTTADLAKAMEFLTLLNHSGRLQQMVQEIEHHDGSFIHAPETHESGTASSSTNPFQSVPWRSNVTYVTTPRPPIHGEPIVHGEKDVLDYCPRYFDEILQVLKLKTQTKAASRARTGCGLNQ